MPSQARQNFDVNFEDIESLIDISNGMLSLDESDGESSEFEINVLYRSALVLMISHWEAYIEDICSEALTHIIENIDNPDELPKEIKKSVAKEINESVNKIEVWKLAGNGWKDYLKQREMVYTKDRNRVFNTPKPIQTNEFIEKVLGLKNITNSWNIDNSSSKDCCDRLVTLVELRGQIAHRGKLEHEVTKDWLLGEVHFIRKIVAKTGGEINSHVMKIVGTGLWSLSV